MGSSCGISVRLTSFNSRVSSLKAKVKMAPGGVQVPTIRWWTAGILEGLRMDCRPRLARLVCIASPPSLTDQSMIYKGTQGKKQDAPIPKSHRMKHGLSDNSSWCVRLQKQQLMNALPGDVEAPPRAEGAEGREEREEGSRRMNIHPPVPPAPRNRWRGNLMAWRGAMLLALITH
jgi:hypothetical protein